MRPDPTHFFRVLAFAGAILTGACSDDSGLEGAVFEAPETAVTYEVLLDGLPTPEMVDLASDALAVYRQQDDGAHSIAFLKRRAEGDVNVLKKILRSRGHYSGTVAVKVTELEREADDGADDRQRALVTLNVEPGPAFVLSRHDLNVDDPSGTAPALDAAGLGSPVGEAAAAAAIVDSETAAIDRLQRSGFPYAQKGKRRAVADLEQATLEIDTPIATGPAATFGALDFEGLEDVRERYLLTYVPWSEGALFNLSQLRDYQQALLATDLFETVSIKPPAEAPGDPGPAPLPVTVSAKERPFQTVSAGARYNTDEGPALTGGYEHRNLFGENETITVEAELGIPMQRIGVGYREPQYQRPGQDLLASFSVVREEDDAFDGLTATGTLGLQRRLTPRWVVGAGGLLEASLITDQGAETTAYLFGLPLFADFDSSDDLLNPSKGARMRLEVTPFAGSFDSAFAGFLTADAVASGYHDLFDDKTYILAARGRLGTILSDEIDTVPQTRRLYSGGGGSVRGFAQRFIGPLDSNNDPEGGRSAAELALELRTRLIGDVGGTIFVEAGSVSEQSFPDFDEGVQVAAGLGFRYFSPAGPIRVDVALPINPRDADDAFQFYFSIGQAF